MCFLRASREPVTPCAYQQNIEYLFEWKGRTQSRHHQDLPFIWNLRCGKSKVFIRSKMQISCLVSTILFCINQVVQIRETFNVAKIWVIQLKNHKSFHVTERSRASWFEFSSYISRSYEKMWILSGNEDKNRHEKKTSIQMLQCSYDMRTFGSQFSEFSFNCKRLCL